MQRLVFGCALALGVFTVVFLVVRHHWINLKVEAVRNTPTITQNYRPVHCAKLNHLTIMIGDSRISRWPSDLLPDPRFLNRGIAGETALRMAARFGADVLERCPDTILIASGINDLVAASLINGSEADDVVDQVIRTVGKLAEDGASTGARVYVATIIPPAKPDLVRRIVWSWSVIDHVKRVNAEIRSRNWQGSVSVIDFAAQLDPAGNGILDENFSKDTLHLNSTAYLRLRDLIRGTMGSHDTARNRGTP